MTHIMRFFDPVSTLDANSAWSFEQEILVGAQELRNWMFRNEIDLITD